jgi:hypothetical protein
MAFVNAPVEFFHSSIWRIQESLYVQAAAPLAKFGRSSGDWVRASEWVKGKKRA